MDSMTLDVVVLVVSVVAGRAGSYTRRVQQQQQQCVQSPHTSPRILGTHRIYLASNLSTYVYLYSYEVSSAI